MYLWSENSSHDFAILHIPILFLMALARVKTFKTRLTPHTNTTDIISMKNRSRDRDSRNTFFWSLNEHFLLTCKNTFKHLKNYFSTRGPRACRNVACCDSSRLGVRSQVQCWTTNCERVGQNKTGRTTSPNNPVLNRMPRKEESCIGPQNQEVVWRRRAQAVGGGSGGNG